MQLLITVGGHSGTWQRITSREMESSELALLTQAIAGHPAHTDLPDRFRHALARETGTSTWRSFATIYSGW